MTAEVVVTMKHIREVGMCSRGARQWAKSRGIDWSEFVTNGISESVLLATGESLAQIAVDAARADPEAVYVERG